MNSLGKQTAPATAPNLESIVGSGVITGRGVGSSVTMMGGESIPVSVIVGSTPTSKVPTGVQAPINKTMVVRSHKYFRTISYILSFRDEVIHLYGFGIRQDYKDNLYQRFDRVVIIPALSVTDS
jgi:hypothetical protein